MASTEASKEGGGGAAESESEDDAKFQKILQITNAAPLLRSRPLSTRHRQNYYSLNIGIYMHGSFLNDTFTPSIAFRSLPILQRGFILYIGDLCGISTIRLIIIRLSQEPVIDDNIFDRVVKGVFAELGLQTMSYMAWLSANPTRDPTTADAYLNTPVSVIYPANAQATDKIFARNAAPSAGFDRSKGFYLLRDWVIVVQFSGSSQSEPLFFPAGVNLLLHPHFLIYLGKIPLSDEISSIIELYGTGLYTKDTAPDIDYTFKLSQIVGFFAMLINFRVQDDTDYGNQTDEPSINITEITCQGNPGTELIPGSTDAQSVELQAIESIEPTTSISEPIFELNDNYEFKKQDEELIETRGVNELLKQIPAEISVIQEMKRKSKSSHWDLIRTAVFSRPTFLNKWQELIQEVQNKTSPKKKQKTSGGKLNKTKRKIHKYSKKQNKRSNRHKTKKSATKKRRSK